MESLLKPSPLSAVTANHTQRAAKVQTPVGLPMAASTGFKYAEIALAHDHDSPQYETPTSVGNQVLVFKSHSTHSVAGLLVVIAMYHLH